MIMVPGRDRRADVAGRARWRRGGGPDPATAALLVLGLGPGPERWLTPEAADALADVDHVVGYRPYLDRVPHRARAEQARVAATPWSWSGRASALDLARAGERVAVVSGGDAGVFGMAAAVFEAAEDPAYADGRDRGAARR